MQRQDEHRSVGMPVFLVIWLICAAIAALIWQNLVSNTPGSSGDISPSAMIVLALSFGLPGAGLVCMAFKIFSE